MHILFLLFLHSVYVSRVSSKPKSLTVPTGFAIKLECLENAKEQMLRCPAVNTTTYEWFQNNVPLKKVPEGVKWSKIYDINETTGALTYFYVGPELNQTVFGCRVVNKDNDKINICGDHQTALTVDVCQTKTRGGIKSLCKFGQCYIEERTNLKYFKCRCFRYHVGFFCDKNVKRDFDDVMQTLLPWTPVFLILTLTFSSWSFMTFCTGHSKKERVFAKHK